MIKVFCAKHFPLYLNDATPDFIFSSETEALANLPKMEDGETFHIRKLGKGIYVKFTNTRDIKVSRQQYEKRHKTPYHSYIQKTLDCSYFLIASEESQTVSINQ